MDLQADSVRTHINRVWNLNAQSYTHTAGRNMDPISLSSCGLLILYFRNTSYSSLPRTGSTTISWWGINPYSPSPSSNSFFIAGPFETFSYVNVANANVSLMARLCNSLSNVYLALVCGSPMYLTWLTKIYPFW
jgi:hypothetical protein